MLFTRAGGDGLTGSASVRLFPTGNYVVDISAALKSGVQTAVPVNVGGGGDPHWAGNDAIVLSQACSSSNSSILLQWGIASHYVLSEC